MVRWAAIACRLVAGVGLAGAGTGAGALNQTEPHPVQVLTLARPDGIGPVILEQRGQVSIRITVGTRSVLRLGSGVPWATSGTRGL